MFPIRYFCARMFAPRYFPEVGAGTGDGVRAYASTSFSAVTPSASSLNSVTRASTTEE